MFMSFSPVMDIDDMYFHSFHEFKYMTQTLPPFRIIIINNNT
nr:hypothetical protein CJLB15_00063 [Campylobacter phage CJLB-15]